MTPTHGTTHPHRPALTAADRQRLADTFGPDPSGWPAPWAQLAAGAGYPVDTGVLLAAYVSQDAEPALVAEQALAGRTLRRVRQDRRRGRVRLADWTLPIPTPQVAAAVLALALVATPLMVAKYPTPTQGRDIAMAGLALGDPLGFDPVLSFVMRLGAKTPGPARRTLP